MDTIQLIESLSNALGAPGFEDEVVTVIKNSIKSVNVERDHMNNVYINNKQDKEKLTIMLDAHSDEVSFMVQFIQENGLIKFLPLGGWIPSNVPAHTVKIQTRQGKTILGITGSTPPHFLNEKEKSSVLSLSDLFVDIGASSREEAINRYGVNIGDPIIPDVTFNYNPENDLMLGKAFDNRLGCAAVIKVIEALESLDLNVNVVGAIATQEEVGLRGARITANRVKPDIAIVFEGSPSDDRFRDKNMAQCILGNGPQIRHRDKSMIANPRLIKLMINTAESLDMPIQSAVRTSGGTNGGSIHLSENGVPTLVIGMPTRYIHTHYSFSRKSDFDDTVKLVAEFISTLDKSKIYSL